MKKILPLLMFCSLFFSLMNTLHAKASTNIPDNLKNEFTLGGQIPVEFKTTEETQTTNFSFNKIFIDKLVLKAKNHEFSDLGETDIHLYKLLDDISEQVKGKKVAVMETRNGWYESILLAYGANPIIVTNKKVVCKDSRLAYISYDELTNSLQSFDFVLSIYDISKKGLGLNNESYDPNADLKEMDLYKSILKDSGRLILSLPVGPDKLIWNSNRIYGQLRMKMLLQGWRILKYYGFTSEHVFFGVNYAPVFLIQQKK